MLAVRFPMLATRMCTVTRARLVVCIGTLLIMAANVKLLFTMKYIKEEITGKETYMASPQ
jgi:hypothetical protein